MRYYNSADELKRDLEGVETSDGTFEHVSVPQGELCRECGKYPVKTNDDGIPPAHYEHGLCVDCAIQAKGRWDSFLND